MENKIKMIPSIYLYGGEILDIDSLEKAAEVPDTEISERSKKSAGGADLKKTWMQMSDHAEMEAEKDFSGNGQENASPIGKANYAAYCEMLCHGGADELLIFDLSDDDAGHEANLGRIKDIADIVDIPIIAGGNAKRLEDVKKYIYAGASRAILNMGVAANEAMIQEASARFGRERIAVYAARMPKREEAERWAEQGAGLLILENTIYNDEMKSPELQDSLRNGFADTSANNFTDTSSGNPVEGKPERSGSADASANNFTDTCSGNPVEGSPENCADADPNRLQIANLPILWMSNASAETFAEQYSKHRASIAGESHEAGILYGVSLSVFRNTTTPLMQHKHQFAGAGLNVFLLETPRPFSEFKKNSDGLIPVIVQDYQTGEVLMLAYMNEEAFDHTLACGRMTYYSRSRQELWEKGFTSGHFQYVKSLAIDCDDDTLLAKVYQVGAACHTGHRSCFYRDLVPGSDQANPLTVFDDVYRVILDRKEHPKEGSYTNYLFDKGIDKILKKVGEEATEIVIAAKNPDAKETVYEISDLLYHVMVLMAEKGISWKEVTTELTRR